MTETLIPNFIADEGRRIFILDGSRIPSISDVLLDNGLINTRFMPDSAAVKGSYAHSLLQYFDEGDYDQAEGERLGLHGHVQSWAKLKERMGFEVLENEVRHFDPVYRFCGRPDRVLKSGKLILVGDFKSGGPKPWHALQTAGQAILIQATKKYGSVIFRYAIYTHADGSEAEIVEHDDDSDLDVFLALLCATNTRLKYGAIRWNQEGSNGFINSH